jgi:hypothetical protein
MDTSQTNNFGNNEINGRAMSGPNDIQTTAPRGGGMQTEVVSILLSRGKDRTTEHRAVVVVVAVLVVAIVVVSRYGILFLSPWSFGRQRQKSHDIHCVRSIDPSIDILPRLDMVSLEKWLWTPSTTLYHHHNNNDNNRFMDDSLGKLNGQYL